MQPRIDTPIYPRYQGSQKLPQVVIQCDQKLLGQFKLQSEIEIGTGGSCKVYKTQPVKNQKGEEEIFIIKKFNSQVPKQLIKHEIEILNRLPDSKYIVKLKGVGLDKKLNKHCLVFPFVQHKEISLYDKLTLQMIRNYMRELLQALALIHSKNLLHGDLKPGNILYTFPGQHVKIIDWGHSEIYSENKSRSPKRGTKYYKAPELILGNSLHTRSIDIWSAGAIFIGLIFKKSIFFRVQRTKKDEISKIFQFIGTQKLVDYIKKYKLQPQQHVMQILKSKQYKKLDLIQYAQQVGIQKIFNSKLALDLISKMLVVDHNQRITAKEALKHEFFHKLDGEPA